MGARSQPFTNTSRCSTTAVVDTRDWATCAPPSSRTTSTLLRQPNPGVHQTGGRSKRLPEPTTAGDFCRRFRSKKDIDALQIAINESRLRLWQHQPAAFFGQAIVDTDGKIAETTCECKEGMDLSYKGQWGYQHLVVLLANTQEVLFQDMRPGNRSSREGAADRLE